MLKHLILQ